MWATRLGNHVKYSFLSLVFYVQCFLFSLADSQQKIQKERKKKCSTKTKQSSRNSRKQPKRYTYTWRPRHSHWSASCNGNTCRESPRPALSLSNRRSPWPETTASGSSAAMILPRTSPKPWKKRYSAVFSKRRRGGPSSRRRPIRAAGGALRCLPSSRSGRFGNVSPALSAGFGKVEIEVRERELGFWRERPYRKWMRGTGELLKGEKKEQRSGLMREGSAVATRQSRYL